MNNAPAIDSAADQLFMAIKENKPDTVKRLLSQNQVNPDSPLPLSMRYDSYNYSPFSDSNVTALHTACYHGHSAIVEQLLKYGANSNACSEEVGSTPLMYAARYNMTDNIVNMLFKAGAKPNLKDCYQKSALHYASHRGHTQLMTQLINHDAMVDVVDAFGSTPLHEAVRSGSHEAVSLLLANHASVNLDRNAVSLIHSAINTKNIKNIISLIKAGYDPAIVETGTRSSLNVTISSTTYSNVRTKTDLTEEDIYLITDMLLNSGFDPNLKDKLTGFTPLVCAVIAGHPEVISLLVDHGARLNALIKDNTLMVHNSVTRRDEVEAMINNLDPITSLQSACRLTIRKALVDGRKPGESLISNAPFLPLPSPLKKYICNIPV